MGYEKLRSQKTIEMAETALMSAVLCIIAPFAIPVPLSPVPLSLATFAVYLAAVLLGTKKGVLCVFVYLLLGLVGLPVFSGFSGGIGVLLGPTGGYLMGYLPCALLVGWLKDIRALGKVFGKYRFVRLVFAMLSGTLVCYLIGTVWFMTVMSGSYTFGQALLVCVVPYLFLDLVKILAVAMIAKPVGQVIRKQR